MSQRVSKPIKIVYLVIGVLCLLLGVIGLIIPVIPGVLFLMAALFLMSRGSRRFKRFSQSNPRMQEMHLRMEKMGQVNYTEKAKVASLILLDAGVRGVHSVIKGISGLANFITKRLNR